MNWREKLVTLAIRTAEHLQLGRVVFRLLVGPSHPFVDYFSGLEEIGASLEKASQVLWKGVQDLVLEIPSKSGV